jgi:hypothetical protein
MTLYIQSTTTITPFDENIRRAWEGLAIAAVRSGLGHAERKHKIFGTVKSGRLKRIGHVLYALEHPEKCPDINLPDWNAQLSYILKGRGQPIPVQVVCDVYTTNPSTNQRYAFELKAPLPSSDITKVSKEKILKLYSMDTPQVDGAYFALPYNPYGARENYNWSSPARWFDMRKDPVVLIGDEFWEKIGGQGMYQTFIAAVNEIGREYKDRTYQEYLGMEPPSEQFNL